MVTHSKTNFVLITTSILFKLYGTRPYCALIAHVQHFQFQVAQILSTNTYRTSICLYKSLRLLIAFRFLIPTTKKRSINLSHTKPSRWSNFPLTRLLAEQSSFRCGLTTVCQERIRLNRARSAEKGLVAYIAHWPRDPQTTTDFPSKTKTYKIEKMYVHPNSGKIICSYFTCRLRSQ